MKKARLIRRIKESDNEWICKILRENWVSTRIVTRQVLYQADRLPGFIAVESNQNVGLLTYHVKESMLEIVSLNVLRQREGIGRLLVQAAITEARSQNCSRVWVITTNDNKSAIKFYQTIGFSIVAVHKDAISKSRKIKPEIPLLGVDDIPIRDEIELEMTLRI